MCRTSLKSTGLRSWLFSALLCFLLLSPVGTLWCQSSAAVQESSSSSLTFLEGEKYLVTGAELNKLSKDLQTAKAELATSQTKNAQLVKDSESKAKALAELQTQLTTVSTSFQKSQNEALIRDGWIGVGGVVLGIAGVLVWDGLTVKR